MNRQKNRAWDLNLISHFRAKKSCEYSVLVSFVVKSSTYQAVRTSVPLGPRYMECSFHPICALDTSTSGGYCRSAPCLINSFRVRSRVFLGR